MYRYAALLLLLPSLAVAQRPQLAPGQQVRATAPAFGLERAHATIEAVAGDTLVLRAATSQRVPFASQERLEVRTGRRSHWLLGAGAGFVVGAGVTYVLLRSDPPGNVGTALCDQSGNQDAIGTGECLGLAALGGLAGAGLGALIGSFIKSDTWEEVPRERFRVGIAPRPNGAVALSVSLAF